MAADDDRPGEQLLHSNYAEMLAPLQQQGQTLPVFKASCRHVIVSMSMQSPASVVNGKRGGSDILCKESETQHNGWSKIL